MKKLMITAAAALCATVGFSEGSITSSNCVGYNNKGLVVKAKQIIGVPFQNVSGGELDLQDIKPLEDGGEVGEGQSTLWWYDTTADEYKYAVWTTDLWEDDGSGGDGIELGYPGWCTDTVTLFIIKDQKFAAGQAFWIKPSDGHKNPSCMIAGEVLNSTSDTVAMPLVPKAKQLVCNPFPTTIDMQDVKPMEDGKDVGEGQSTAWWYDTTADEYKYAVWTTDLWEDDGSGGDGIELGYPGWCTDTVTLFIIPKKTLNPGDGFWVKPSDGHKVPQLSFPNPLITK